MARPFEHFRRLVEATAEVDVVRASLEFAREEYPEVRPEAYLGRLAELALELAPRITGIHDPRRVVDTLCAFLFREKGFRGNDEEYYDPRNSYLNQVLDRGLGIPISLSAVTIDLARRLFLPIHGVGFPGHFLLKYRTEAVEILFDAYHGGVVLNREDCQARLDRTYGGTLALEDSHLEVTPPREILARMFQNLKAIYGRDNEYERMLRVLNYLLIVRPDDPRELRTRAEVRYHLGQYEGAEHDLVRSLSRWPAADPGRAPVEAMLAQVRRMRGRMN